MRRLTFAIIATMLIFQSVVLTRLPSTAQAAAASQAAERCVVVTSMVADACPIQMGEVITDYLREPGQSKAYRYRAAPRANVVGRVRMVLDDLPADYDLHLVTSDRRVLASSINEGTQPEAVELFGAVGDNFFYVTSDPGRAVAPDQPFHLRALLPSEGDGNATDRYTLRFWALDDEQPVSGVDLILADGALRTTDEAGQAEFASVPTLATGYNMRNDAHPELFPNAARVPAFPGAAPGTLRVVLVLLQRRDLTLTVMAGDDGVARVDWAPYPGAVSYRVDSSCKYNDTDYGGIKSDVTQQTSLTMPITAGTYDWRVTAFSAIGRPLARGAVGLQYGPPTFCSVPAG